MTKKIDYANLFTHRKDGRYQGYWRELDKNGEPKGPRHCICDKEPERLFQRIQEKETPRALTFSEIAEAWKDYLWPKIRDGTRVCYNPAYQRALKQFGDRPATDIQPFEISNHLQALQAQDYSSQTIKTQLVIYRAVYRHAIIDPKMGEEIRINPALNVPLPRGMKKPFKREAPEDDIVEKVRNGTDVYFGLFPLFVMSTGFRRGEALAVQWQDVDFMKKTISCSKQVSYEGGISMITETKTEAGIRKVPILPDLLFYLKAAKPENAEPTHYVFYGTDPAKYISESTYKRRWMHYCKDMGFVTDEPEERVSKQGEKYIKHNYKPTLTAHILRHGYATMLFEAGVDTYTAQHLLGHADIETTMAIYTHLRQKKKAASLKKLEDFVAQQMDRNKL